MVSPLSNLKIFGDNVILANCDVIKVFLIYAQFKAIWKPDFGRVVCKSYIFIESNLLLYKNWKQN